MLNTEKVSVEAFCKALKAEDNYVKIDWDGTPITVRKTIGIEDAVRFAKTVVAESFSETNNEYIPYLKDYSIRRCVLELYANFTMPDDISMQYDLVYQTGVFDAVIAHINKVQFSAIIESINEKIDNIAQANVNSVTAMATDVYSLINSMSNRVDGLFELLPVDDIKSITDAFSSGRINTDELAKSIIALKKNDVL